MGTTLRDVLGWLVDLKDWYLRTVLGGFGKLFDLQILDITFAEWLFIGFFGFLILYGIANWGSIFGSKR